MIKTITFVIENTFASESINALLLKGDMFICC